MTSENVETSYFWPETFHALAFLRNEDEERTRLNKGEFIIEAPLGAGGGGGSKYPVSL